ncbi:MAG: F0F1 ATP synthase subunit A [Candidatus Sericytochromatia bacterium]
MKPFLLAQEGHDGQPGHGAEPATAPAAGTSTDNAAHGLEHVAEGGGHATEGGITVGEHWIQEIPGLGALHVDTVGSTVIIMVALLIIFALLAKTINPVPTQQSGAVGTVIEGIVEFCQKIIHDFIGPRTAPYLWYVGAIFVFILTANWLSLLPWRAWELSVGNQLGHAFHAPHAISYHAPTADLNTTAALALISLVLYWYFGIKHGGIGGFLGHHWFAKPVALFPLRMLEDVTRPLSLALRLFANMTAGHMVGLVLLTLTFFVVPAIMLPLELFVGAVQAFIFAALSASYIGAAMADDHH